MPWTSETLFIGRLVSYQWYGIVTSVVLDHWSRLEPNGSHYSTDAAIHAGSPRCWVMMHMPIPRSADEIRNFEKIARFRIFSKARAVESGFGLSGDGIRFRLNDRLFLPTSDNNYIRSGRRLLSWIHAGHVITISVQGVRSCRP
jgi:hypothetical protein